MLGFGISDGLFGTVFYTLTGFHGAHVFGGVVGLTIITARASQGQFSARNHVAVEAVSIYWHFVDVGVGRALHDPLLPALAERQ